MDPKLKSLAITLLSAGLAWGAVAAHAEDEPPAQPALAAPGALPELDADEYFEGQTPGTFGKNIVKVLPMSQRVAIAGFKVVFITENTATASVRATYLPGGRETTAAHSRMTVKLEGVDAATMQKLTDQAYAAFVQQMVAAGRELVPLEQVQPVFASLELAQTTAEAPYSKKGPNGLGLAFAPAGIPLWWMNGDAYGDITFSQKNMRTVPDLSKSLDAIVIAPEFVVSFAKMESSGNRSGFLANEAKVGISQLAVAVRQVRSHVWRALDTKMGLVSKGEEGDLHMVRGVAVETPFADVEDIEEKKSSKWAAMWTGSAKAGSVKAAVTDNERYGAVAQQALNQATGAMAKFFAQHPPAQP